MSNRWIVLDVSFLCWKVYYTDLRKLSHHEIPTGVLFGFVNSFVRLQEHHGTKNVAFCFDAKESHRKAILPGYKQSREEKKAAASSDEKSAMQAMYKQIRLLRKHLAKVGFQNIFYEEGYEADDMMASVVENNPDKELVLVSADKDLYQLLRPGVSIYTSTVLENITDTHFRLDWGIEPLMWAWVKAIAGCNTDDVPGCPGVGEIKAVQFLKKVMNKKSKTYAKIKAFKQQAIANLKLVQLPFDGCPALKLVPDEISREQWTDFLKEFGIRSLRNNPPKLKRRGLADG